MPLLIRVAGISGSGKTTLLQELLGEFNALGHSTACLKHSHHDLELPVKDSTRLFQASTDGSVVVGQNVVSITLPLNSRTPMDWTNLLFPETDIVFVEGWRAFDLPTILLNTNITDDWTMPKTIIATIGENKMQGLPHLENNTEVRDYILELLNSTQKQ